MPDVQAIQALSQGLVDVSMVHPPFYKGMEEAGAVRIATSLETGLGASAGLDDTDLAAAFGNVLTLSPRTVNETRAQFVGVRVWPYRWVAFLAREITLGCIMIAGAVEYDDRPGPQRDAMVSIITGWKAELLKAIRQAVHEGHLKRDTDAHQMVFEVYGLMLAMHQDARLLRSADSAKRARAGLRRLLDDARTEAAPPSVSSRRPAKRGAAPRTRK